MSMKRFLLIAAATLIVGSANAQLTKFHKSGKLQQAKQKVEQTSTFKKKFEVAGKKQGVKAVLDKTSKKFKGSAKVADLKPASKMSFSAKRAATVQPLYEGSGTLRSTNEAVTWEMEAGVVTLQDESQVNVLKDVILNIFAENPDFADGIFVEYTLEEGNIVIEPQLIASFPHEDAPTGTYYIFLEDAKSNDGKITLKLDNDGNIVGSYTIIYSIYPAEIYNYNDWVATYDGISGAQYNVPGVVKAPAVSFEPSNLVLFAGLGLNGYSYSNNLAAVGAFASTNFNNLTTDKATAWDWLVTDESTEDPTVYATGSDRNFTLDMKNGIVSNLQLVGTNQTESSEPFIFGVGKSFDDAGVPNYETCYIYGGQYFGGSLLNNETPPIVTRQDPDGDLTFYANWATPDKAENSMSKIYMYHEKPATPLYIEGITLPMVAFEAQPDFNLHIKIVKCSYPEGSNRPELGDVIAEGNATIENINDEFSAGLTAVEIPLYSEDEFGMSTDLDYLYLDDEFIIVIEGWDNGTFSGVLGCQDEPLEKARTSTWFEMTGAEGSFYSYTTWKTSLFVGFLEAIYGYMITDDDTNVTIPAEGGEASIHVTPMFYANGDDGGLETLIGLTEDSEEIPSWLTVQYSNPVSDEDISFDLLFSAEGATENRSVTLKFTQPGAVLEVTVSQGAGSGISVVTNKVETAAPAFNLAGQRVNKNFKGLVVKDGSKVMVK